MVISERQIIHFMEIIHFIKNYFSLQMNHSYGEFREFQPTEFNQVHGIIVGKSMYDEP